MIHGSFETAGQRGFPMPVAQSLAAKYGYARDRVPAARSRIADVLGLFDRQLEDGRASGCAYLLGDELTALDIYLATFLTPMVASEIDCPDMLPPVRPAFAYLREAVGSLVSPTLAAHRELMFERYLPYPIPL